MVDASVRAFAYQETAPSRLRGAALWGRSGAGAKIWFMCRSVLCSAFLLIIVAGCGSAKHWYIEKVVPAGNSTGSREAVFGGPFDSE
jgi:hypothetical protein